LSLQDAGNRLLRVMSFEEVDETAAA